MCGRCARGSSPFASPAFFFFSPRAASLFCWSACLSFFSFLAFWSFLAFLSCCSFLPFSATFSALASVAHSGSPGPEAPSGYAGEAPRRPNPRAAEHPRTAAPVASPDTANCCPRATTLDKSLVKASACAGPSTSALRFWRICAKRASTAVSSPSELLSSLLESSGPVGQEPQALEQRKHPRISQPTGGGCARHGEPPYHQSHGGSQQGAAPAPALLGPSSPASPGPATEGNLHPNADPCTGPVSGASTPLPAVVHAATGVRISWFSSCAGAASTNMSEPLGCGML